MAITRLKRKAQRNKKKAKERKIKLKHLLGRITTLPPKKEEVKPKNNLT